MEIIKWDNINKKNEKILNLAESALKKNKAVLLLEPRLQNISYIYDILKQNFNEPINIYHSKLKKTEKRNIWLNALKGKIKIIIATRHGVFLPLKNLDLIIFDDEEDDDFKSVNQKPYYDARIIAKLRNANVVSFSQSPRVGTDFQELDKLAVKPEVTIVDLKTGDYSPISYSLKKAIQNTLQKEKKVILFLNRKGEASFVSCKDCGFVWRCDRCEFPLKKVETQNIASLQCNHCKIQKEIPLVCDNCKGANIHFSGIGTQKLEKELKKIFLNKKIIRIEKNISTVGAPTAHSASTVGAPTAHSIKEADVIIGTEYLYKNYLYPFNKIKNIGLIVLPAADTLFNYPDFRTDEKAFAWIVKFRNLAIQESAELIIQTYSPENEVLRLACRNSLDFYKREYEIRKKFGYG